jgi:RNA polymerase sigma-70 factor (ECF subfamily)
MEFAEFFARTRDDTFRAMLAATGDRAAAEDAIAEAFTRAYARWSDVERHPNPRAWVLRTAINAHRSAWRRRRREVLAANLPEPSTSDSVAERWIDPGVRAAVAALPTRQREVVALRLVADYTSVEAAWFLGVAPATVDVHLHRALASLRRWLDPDSPEAETPPEPSSMDRSELVEFAALLRRVRHAF